MATVAMDISKPPPAAGGDEAAAAKGRGGAGGGGGEGLRQYYLQHIHDLQLQIRQKTHNLNRLEAQRNDLNSRGDVTLAVSPCGCDAVRGLMWPNWIGACVGGKPMFTPWVCVRIVAKGAIFSCDVWARTLGAKPVRQLGNPSVLV